jgi:hypothetical protein
MSSDICLVSGSTGVSLRSKNCSFSPCVILSHQDQFPKNIEQSIFLFHDFWKRKWKVNRVYFSRTHQWFQEDDVRETPLPDTDTNLHVLVLTNFQYYQEPTTYEIFFDSSVYYDDVVCEVVLSSCTYTCRPAAPSKNTDNFTYLGGKM